MISKRHPEVRNRLPCPWMQPGAPGSLFRYENKPADDTCDHCGSLLADDFMARIEAEYVILCSTDKNYKVYVINWCGKPFRKSSRTDDCKSADQSLWTWETREVEECKFYFQHLSQEQQRRFIELLNQKKLKLDYPGHFYKMPYFIEIKSGDSK